MNTHTHELIDEAIEDAACWKVQACNSRAALIEALVELGEYMKICPNEKSLDLAGVIANTRAAISKAEGRK